MAGRLLQLTAALITTAAVLLPAPALADTDHDSHTDSSPGSSHGTSTDADHHGDSAEGHEHGDSAEGHEHGDSQEPDAGHEHGDEPGADAGHDEGSHDGDSGHGTGAPDTVSPEVRRLVLGGFAGVNGALVLTAFFLRRVTPGRSSSAVRGQRRTPGRRSPR